MVRSFITKCSPPSLNIHLLLRPCIYLAEVFYPAILTYESANFARKLKGYDGSRMREIGATLISSADIDSFEIKSFTLSKSTKFGRVIVLDEAKQTSFGGNSKNLNYGCLGLSFMKTRQKTESDVYFIILSI